MIPLHVNSVTITLITEDAVIDFGTLINDVPDIFRVCRINTSGVTIRIRQTGEQRLESIDVSIGETSHEKVVTADEKEWNIIIPNPYGMSELNLISILLKPIN